MDDTDPDTQVRQTLGIESNVEGCEVFNQPIVLVSLHAYAGEVEVKFSGKLLKFGFLAFVLLCLSSLFAGFVFLLVGWQFKHECLQNDGITELACVHHGTLRALVKFDDFCDIRSVSQRMALSKT